MKKKFIFDNYRLCYSSVDFANWIFLLRDRKQHLVVPDMPLHLDYHRHRGDQKFWIEQYNQVQTVLHRAMEFYLIRMLFFRSLR